MPLRPLQASFSLTIVLTATLLLHAEDGLVLHYAMQEGRGAALQDGSGLGNQGAIVGHAAWKTVDSAPALELNGADSYIECGPRLDAVSLEKGFTLLAWVCFYRAEGGWDPDPKACQRSYLFASPGKRGFSIACNNGQLIVTESRTWKWVACHDVLGSDQWLQLAVTIAHGKIGFFVNGAAAGEADLPQLELKKFTAPVLLGTLAREARERLWGCLGEVRLYDRVLSSAEVKSHYKSTTARFPTHIEKGVWYRGDAPFYATTDLYATSDSMLVHTDRDGVVRKLWAGFTEGGKRSIPLMIKTDFQAEIRRGGSWIRLGDMKLKSQGTRPGFIRLQSEDGFVAMQVSAKKNEKESPVFLSYTFAKPCAVRFHARVVQPRTLEASHYDPAASALHCAVLWNEGPWKHSKRVAGPELAIACKPACAITEKAQGEYVLESAACRQFIACLDATGRRRVAGADVSVDRWLQETGGSGDSQEEHSAQRVRLETDDVELNAMFRASIDAVRSLQFLTGCIHADAFYYCQSWQRDGSLAVRALSIAGELPSAFRYFDFWMRDGGFSVGGQREAQQPAITIMALWFQSRLEADDKKVLKHFWPFVKKFADYYCGRIAKEGGMLSLADEWICYMPVKASWPNAEVYGGLRAAAKIARVLGKPEAAAWQAAAARLRTDFDARAYDKKLKRFIPHAGAPGEQIVDKELPSGGGPARDERVDSGLLAIARYEALGKGQGLVAVDDPRSLSTFDQIVKTLGCPDGTFNLFGPEPKSPFTPEGAGYSFTALQGWVVGIARLQNDPQRAWKHLFTMLRSPNYNAVAANYYLPEARTVGKPQSGDPMITWVPGEFVVATLYALLGTDFEPQGADISFSPSLPKPMRFARIDNFSYRGRRLSIALRREKDAISCTIEMRGGGISAPLAVRLPDGSRQRLAVHEKIVFTRTLPE